MKHLRLFAYLLLFSVMCATGASAQEDLGSYFQKSEPYMNKLRGTVGAFLQEIQPLREKKDLVGLKNTADKYIEIWDGYVTELGEIEAPPEAEVYHNSLVRLHELQRESNQIMSDTLGYRIKVLLEARDMKANGTPEEEVNAFIQKSALDRDELLRKTKAVKTETQNADATLKAEREKLLAKVKPDSE